ncbi:MAG: hypothetical protein ACTSRZ_04635 [Promethearchaeota archaeon]
MRWKEKKEKGFFVRIFNQDFDKMENWEIEIHFNPLNMGGTLQAFYNPVFKVFVQFFNCIMITDELLLCCIMIP